MLRHFSAVPIVLGALAIAPASASAFTDLSPGFPTIDPALAADHYFNRIQFSVNVSTDPGSGQSNSGSQTIPTEGKDVNTLPIISVQTAADLGVNYGNEQTVAQGSTFGSSGGGTLKAFAQAYVHAGAARAEAFTTIDMIDTLTVDEGGLPDFSLDISGTPTSQTIDSHQYASSYGSMDYYVWPVSQGVPTAGMAFTPALHQHYEVDPDRTMDYVESDPNADFATGSKWYFSVRITAHALANIDNIPWYFSPQYNDLQAVADFSHSVTLHIDADPSTPDFSFSTASGINYASPVPEPATALGLLPGVAFLLVRGRNRRQQATSG